MGKMGKDMARSPRPASLAPVVLVMLLITVPGLLFDARATPAHRDVPPALDRFLASVRAATPPQARILVAGAPPSLTYYRATYLLYPRRVYSAFPTDYAHGWSVPPLRWADVQAQALRDGARYILLWALPLAPRGAVAVRSGAGTLVEAS